MALTGSVAYETENATNLGYGVWHPEAQGKMESSLLLPGENPGLPVRVTNRRRGDL